MGREPWVLGVVRELIVHLWCPGCGVHMGCPLGGEILFIQQAGKPQSTAIWGQLCPVQGGRSCPELLPAAARLSQCRAVPPPGASPEAARASTLSRPGLLQKHQLYPFLMPAERRRSPHSLSVPRCLGAKQEQSSARTPFSSPASCLRPSLGHFPACPTLQLLNLFCRQWERSSSKTARADKTQPPLP